MSLRWSGRGSSGDGGDIFYNQEKTLSSSPSSCSWWLWWLAFICASSARLKHSTFSPRLPLRGLFFFFPTLKKCWGSIPVAQGRRALNCCAVTKACCDRDLPIIVITGIDKLIPAASFRAPNYILNQTSAIVSTFCRLTFCPLHLDSPLIPRLPLPSVRASAPCPRASIKVIKSFQSLSTPTCSVSLLLQL